MRTFKRAIALAVISTFISTSSFAADSALKTVFQDIFYGGLSGGLVGAAVLAFTKHPGDHLAYIGYGAAAGVLVGATVGAVTTTRSLAEIKQGEVKFAMPTIMPELRESGSKTAIVATAELLRGTF